MKKVLFLLAILTLSSCRLPRDEAFVNPVFYGKMESQTDLWDVTITPTTFDMDNRHGTTWHEDCEMWKNEPDEVVLRCTHQLNKEQLEMQSPEDVYGIRTEEHNTYVMKIRPPEEQIYKDRTRIIIYSYYEDETNPEFASKRGYHIRTPEAGARIKR